MDWTRFLKIGNYNKIQSVRGVIQVINLICSNSSAVRVKYVSAVSISKILGGETRLNLKARFGSPIDFNTF